MPYAMLTEVEVAPPRPRRVAPKSAAAILLASSFTIVLFNTMQSHEFFRYFADACDWIQHNLLVGALIFVPVEIIWVMLCIPTTPLELAAGYSFGFGWGFVVDSIGKLLGACASFFVGRHCLRTLVVRQCLEGSGSENLMRAIDGALNTTSNLESFQLLLLVQLACNVAS